MRSARLSVATSAALLLAALPLIAAHGDDASDDMSMNLGVAAGMAATSTLSSQSPAETFPPSYFRHPHQSGWIYAHIFLMVVSWVIVLPIALMLSHARSRYHLPAQIAFHVANGLGLFMGFVYQHSTPDLYTHNSHVPIGWVATGFTISWTLTSLFVAYGEYKSKAMHGSRHASSGHHAPLSAQGLAHHNRMQQPYFDRFSGDSARGTDRNTASLYGPSRQNSADDIYAKPEALSPSSDAEGGEFDHADDNNDHDERRGFLGDNRVDRFLSRNVLRLTTQRISKAVRFGQIVLEKLLLLIGFFALTTGFVVYGGIFRSHQVFSGLAHFIKGGIFFWYGLLTLGRWMGAFAEFGWAWNARPTYPTVARWKTRVPSAEFTESFVIWLYGASNVFLEHLGGAGGAWSPQDFEHVSITLLFFGGGLLGMLVESSVARNLLNMSVSVQQQQQHQAHDPEVPDPYTPPPSHSTPLNPLPALVILLLGRMMSAHQQTSMVSTMLHAQWGTLFCGFALARVATYVLMYVRPPVSRFAGRPPTELVAAFCLVSGGLLFMLSARDTVSAVEANGLDAMTVFTVGVGFTGLVMAWVIVCFAVRGWAVRREMRSGGAARGL